MGDRVEFKVDLQTFGSHRIHGKVTLKLNFTSNTLLGLAARRVASVLESHYPDLDQLNIPAVIKTEIMQNLY